MWCLVRYLDPIDKNLARILKIDKDFARELDFKDVNFLSKFKNIQKIRKKIVSALMFLVIKTKKNTILIYY